MTRIVRGGGEVSDARIEALLRRVYVDENFTDASVAQTVFAASAVRARGELLFAFAPNDDLAGMLIVVLPTAPGRRIAGTDEAELQLLAVLPEFRGQGIALRLVEAANDLCREAGIGRLVLWTQPNMHAAQRLYVRNGFVRRPERDASLQAPPGRTFLVFEKQLVS